MTYRIEKTETFGDPARWPLRVTRTLYACEYNGLQAWTQTDSYSRFSTYAMAQVELDSRYAQGHIYAGQVVKIVRI